MSGKGMMRDSGIKANGIGGSEELGNACKVMK